MGWEPRGLLELDTFADWRPFLLAAKEARLQDAYWALDPLDFQLSGKIVRAKRGPLWTYVHVRTGGSLSVDEGGVPHQVRLDRAMRIRTKPIDVLAAVWRTGVPEEELAREPVHRGVHTGWEECGACEAWFEEQDRLQASGRWRRRRPAGRSEEAVTEDASPKAPAGRHLRLVRPGET
jgi:hypothetical protein